jgi:hypothetical protein
MEDYTKSFRDDSLQRNEIKKIYKQYSFTIDTSNSKLLFLSDPWVEATVKTIMANLTLEYGRLPTIKETFETIKNNYTGLLQEKLFGKLLLDPFLMAYFASKDLGQDNLDIMNCLDSAYILAKTSYVKEYFGNQIKFNRGKPAYDFNLIDTNGKAVMLSQFLGKTVLLDMWGVGCTGCALFYRLYTDSLEPKLKNDTSFVLISISTDTSQEVWKKSLYSGIYTNPNHLNLNVGSEGFNNDFIRYYNVSAIPFVLLIDRKGRIYQRMRTLVDPKSLLSIFLKAEEN